MLLHHEAPDFTLPLFEGPDTHFYRDFTDDSVLIFYKFSCPTCCLALPFLQILYETYCTAVKFLAIAQDGPEKTGSFRREYGITIPTAMDLPPYATSTAYAVRSVPTIFLINKERKIVLASEGFVKQEFVALAARLAQRASVAPIDLFSGAEVPEIKPG